MPDNLLKNASKGVDGAPKAVSLPKPAPSASENLLKASPQLAGAAAENNADDPLAAFRTGPDGALDVEALADAYVDLVRTSRRSPDAKKDSGGRSLDFGPDMDPDQRRKIHAALGVPDSPDGYDVTLQHALFERDPGIEKTLHEAGFSTRQVQLVYDLAAERMMPFIEEIAGELKAEHDLKHLMEAFGGEDRWRETSRQLLKWGRKNLPADVVDSLATSYDGVMALHRMMTGEDTSGRLMAGDGGKVGGDEDLDRMIRDPRYWKQKDPAFVRKVTDGFKRLYPED